MTGHRLIEVSTVTNHVTGWQPLPAGGSVPIVEPLPRSHHRWYCACGAVGGKSSTVEAATAGHSRHAADQ